jgi:pre-mRNA-splicing helicase BRR2
MRQRTDVPQRQDAAEFVNSYPTLDVTHDFVKGEYTSSTPIVLQVSLSRDADEEEDEGDISVVAPHFPGKKMANWWVVVGEQSTRQLLSIKRVTVSKSLRVKLEFTLPKGTHLLKLYVICDSYVGADHDINLEPLEVAEGEDSDSDEYSDGSDGSGDEMEVEK